MVVHREPVVFQNAFDLKLIGSIQLYHHRRKLKFAAVALFEIIPICVKCLRRKRMKEAEKNDTQNTIGARVSPFKETNTKKEREIERKKTNEKTENRKRT